MHGPEWLTSPVFSLSLIAVGLFFLFLALRTENEHRARQHNKEYDGIEISVIGRKVIDTSRGWIFFTLFLGGMAMGGHFLAEYTFHLYDETPIDRVTHGLSGMAITAIFLNLSDKEKASLLSCKYRCFMGFVCTLGSIRMDKSNYHGRRRIYSNRTIGYGN